MDISFPPHFEYETETRVVYLKKSGQIVFSQEHLRLKRNKRRPEKDIEAELIKKAVTLLGKPSHQLAVLKLKKTDTYSGDSSRVDVQKRKLIQVEIPQGVDREKQGKRTPTKVTDIDH